ncbi:hypothetical protein PanWU01x14_046460 [Parasponia andersonii]|uniref:Uncharacterized protein n=1 Tax=Parasponia andersonii TaxID=3476 RepID=A0A2P5DNQ1_PARAD|nr:hypothetical protein PanWU01x14_046460 [Parasponia andersonii]
MPRGRGQTSHSRGDQDNDKDTTIHRLAELVERQAQQIGRLIERDQRRDEQLPIQVVARQENHEPAFERFRKNKPPVFKGETDPLLAEEWIRSLEGIFDYIRIPDEEKVSCATYMFQMDARHWWCDIQLLT